MAIHSAKFYEQLAEIDDQYTKIQSMPTRVLWQKIIVETLFNLSEGSTAPWYWVLDALDESESASEVISLVGKIQSVTPMRVLMTSRVGMDIQRVLQSSVARGVLRCDHIEAADTRNDMAAHARQQLEGLPFDDGEIDGIVHQIVHKSQGIFLWVRFVVEEILLTAHTIDGILDGMSKMRESNKKLARAIIQNTVCAARPLRTRELQEILTPSFGRLASLEYTIRKVCPHLIKVDETTSLVQPIHETVREFLLGNPTSEFAVDSPSAHQYLAKVCLDMWMEAAFSEPISEQTSTLQNSVDMDDVHPLLRYAAMTWFEHVQTALIDEPLEASVRQFLRTSVLFWIEAVGLLGDLSLLAMAALGLQAFAARSPLISLSDKELISGWSVDLVRIGPKYGRNILSCPFSVHRLLPPFCPTKTRIGSQFGAAGEVAVVGAGMKSWDDCLAHITVGREGETCKAVVCGDVFLIVALSGSKGQVVILDTETCQEVRRLSHGETIGTVNIDSLSDRLVTGGFKWVKVWDLKSGEMVVEQSNTAGARCIALAICPGGGTIVSFTSDNSLTTWDLARDIRKQLRWTHQHAENSHRGTPRGVTFNRTAAMISLAWKGWPMEVWNIERLKMVAKIPMRHGLGPCFNESNGNIYGVELDGSVVRFDAQCQTTTELDLQSHILACNSQGTLIATGNGHGVLRIFTADTLEPVYTLDKYTDSINGLCFSPDGSKLYDIRSSNCNVWTPDVFLVNAREDSSVSGAESENSSFNRIPPSVAMEASRGLVSITAIVSDSTGSYVCCGMGNGAIFVYETQSGKRLQFLYNHACTVNVNALAWSLSGFYIASGDDSGRIMVARIDPLSSSKWSCAAQLDFRLDPRLDGGGRQILISHDDARVLVSTQLSSRMFCLQDGEEVGERFAQGQNATPCWLTHPGDPSKVILFTLGLARIFEWTLFAELGDGKGVKLRHRLASTWENKAVLLRALPTQDGRKLLLEARAVERGNPTKCSFWDVSQFDEGNEEATETGNLNHRQLDGVVGVYHDRAVFLDRELWVCSSAVGGNSETTKHFFVPMDWLNTSEERPSLMTRLGDFVYAKHGEVIIVKRGMRAKHGVL
ncbi:hypothetical protein PLICBS_005402 [Purpureocillium lilacinum]|uniref:uncharacterized protein n=1 Tax=Purpureocillium lilacinum TaxID=33203 RepID=UPI0020802D32|nr:hypothetical protein PLICBS_005402 [Purpureocillium lilacinum]